MQSRPRFAALAGSVLGRRYWVRFIPMGGCFDEIVKDVPVVLVGEDVPVVLVGPEGSQ